ncbi:MAG TPA: HNH endonuclease signature motif containing protein, partial [Candidatus Dormibacteraeota bacterium]|nr:HNH endonuclease signature motif containing protein [Candidatus Dormibacteraeota bacterium]
SMVIDVGRAQRVVPGATRRALNVRDKGCVWPGCDRPVSRTQAHHLIHWCRGGETNLANTVLLCHRHHWMVHEGGWQIIRNGDGTIFTVRPPVQFDRMERDLRYLFEPPDPPEPEPQARSS